MYYKIHTDKAAFENWLKIEMTQYSNDVGAMIQKAQNPADIYLASDNLQFLTILQKKYKCVEVDTHPPAALLRDYSYLGDSSFFDTDKFI